MTHRSSFVKRLILMFALFFSAATWANGPRYLSWYERDELSEQELQNLPDFCHGAYRIPDITPLADENITIEANRSSATRSGDLTLSGNIQLQQLDRQIYADEGQWLQQQGTGEFHGNLTLLTPEIQLHGEQATFDQAKGEMNIRQAQYSAPARHFRGAAGNMQSFQSGQAHLTDATFTFCEPGRNDWDIAASTLNLDTEAGIGSVWNARLRIAEIPVLYVPYYRFPIGDQRMTGFLNPMVVLNGKLQGEDIQLPFYLNLAPNYDATITPHYILDHGLSWETQFRHKTRWFGDGELNYAYLHEDETTQDKRWMVNYKQQGNWGNGWQHRWVYNNVSDSEYLNDMNPTASVNRTTHLPRRGEIIFNQNDWHFDFTAESFQTVDESINLVNRPYQRLPQINLWYRPLNLNQWQLQQTLQVTRFARKEEDLIRGARQQLTGANAVYGDRVLSDTSLSYPMQWPFGFLTPKVEYRHRSYRLESYDDAYEVEDQNIGSVRASLDAGLYFDRFFSVLGNHYQQTLEPRLFWVKSPYVDDQDLIPNFDSADITVTYNNLFTGERFTGGDRLADLDQVSLGLTSRIIRDNGNELLRASVGQIQYFDDRRVTLNNASSRYNARNRSSTLAEVEWSPLDTVSLYYTLEWDPYEDYARQNRYGVRYDGNNNQMLSVALNSVKQYNEALDRVDTDRQQLDVGVFWSLSDRWALIGRALYDVKSYRTDETPPENKFLESLLGVEYQSCCWRVQLLYRESSLIDGSTNLDTDRRYGVLLNIQLKGLGSFGGSTETLLSDGIYGYSRRTYHDY